MKQSISLIMIFLMVLLACSGCGNKSAPPAKSQQEAASTGSTPAENVQEVSGDGAAQSAPASSQIGGIYEEAGSELQNFYDAFNGGLAKFERAVNDFETDDFELFDVGWDYQAAATVIVTITQYDYLEPGDNAREEGKMGEYEGLREKNGDVITFQKTMTRAEDGFGGNSKKGDVIKENGSLNTATNTLYVETTTEREGAVVARSVCEVIIQDGQAISQVLQKPMPPTDGRIEDKGLAYFMCFDENQLEVIAASFAPDVNFTYNSIAGKTDVTPESMTQGYNKIRRLTVAGDKASAERY